MNKNLKKLMIKNGMIKEETEGYTSPEIQEAMKHCRKRKDVILRAALRYRGRDPLYWNGERVTGSLMHCSRPAPRGENAK